MPSRRQRPFVVMRKTVTRPILARIYSVQQGRRWVKIPTLDNGNGQDPMCTHALDGPWTQPHKHNCELQIIHGRRSDTFRIFCKNHIFLRENDTVKAIVGEEYRWCGSIVVMRAGKGEKKWVVNMRGCRDTVLADYALDQFIKHVQQRKRFSFPKHLVFRMP
ncbi:uncharacterized protein EV420DRAFT_1640964 [Desarmillaria tabescens]|uniref:Uncharacterized protein n=1 Tax=Armillaria tabescens TaxID=1929756 RepID=A0AA39KI74_ARMTA|nr:uncharacterized protein EV420DRAFT_1640964 [Desarmillaria tabescens]KAK0460419.1 hypothetical protein EV420DRAFT_1640964 [Desarmillaria tabescens]